VREGRLKIMLIDEQPDRFALVEQALQADGHEIVARLSTSDDLIAAVERAQPDIIIVDLQSPGRDTLEHMHSIARDRPRPIVMFTNDGDSATIERAIKAGVTAYVVDGLNPERIRPILDVAIHRFREFQQLRQELEQARNQLAERKVIEKAKGILMKKRGMDEDQAYRMLRKMAMDRNLRLADLARSLIAAADILT
jgi:response regulator NasT